MSAFDEKLLELKQVHEAAVGTLTTSNMEMAEKLVQIQAELSTTKEKLAECEAEHPEPEPEPPGTLLWLDEFVEPPDPALYILACDDPARNFILDSRGNLRVRYITGKKEPDGDPVLRSEIIRRKPGTWHSGDNPKVGIPLREDVGGTYHHEIEFTIPGGWKPPKANEATLVTQFHQTTQTPPIQFHVVDPAMTDDPFIFRIVPTSPAWGPFPARKEAKETWKVPISKGKRYRLVFLVRWGWDVQGWLSVDLSQHDPATLAQEWLRHYEEEGPDCFGPDVTPHGLAGHAGIYQPGSRDEAAGIVSELIFHRYGVWRLA